ncbi:hypothetical protein LTV02_26940 [Nocardia yamanashiensis]|uniref:hypothetical protein n=1 Tax=Nocardia yamanashiensis TaxID=209247 RepID=UPI001E387492|nr:hypothetical protein [Nocardia yamanashiensis]UGT39678.1 hypothetical protein LTV02_26940 [Nocardia yamanashiensis]
MRLANSFDGMDSHGKPIVSSKRTAVSDPNEFAKIEQFLSGGGFAMGTGRKSVDLIDPERGNVVPSTFRTDGEWLWTAAIGYYLTEYRTPIDTDFLTHIRNSGYVASVPSEAQMQQALIFLDERSKWLSAAEVCIVSITSAGDSEAAFAIDGRNYSNAGDFNNTVREAFDELNARSVNASFETSPIGISEPPFALPTWDRFRETLD